MAITTDVMTNYSALGDATLYFEAENVIQILSRSWGHVEMLVGVA